MNAQQKESIQYLRGLGYSYSKISAMTGISENTVKSFCRRNTQSGEINTTSVSPTGNYCHQCGSPIKQTAGMKPKRFCSDKCRLTWWNSHPEAITHKIVRQFTCQSCGREFTSYGNRTRKYCSRSCYAHAKVVRE